VINAGKFLQKGVHLEGSIKNRIEDFKVSENLTSEPMGEGGFFWYYIEKRNISTLRAQDIIAGFSNTPKKDVKYAGLKDKRAVTRQWFSTTKEVKKLPQGMQIIKATKNPFPVILGQLKDNSFEIVVDKIEKKDYPEIKRRIEGIKLQGVPNYFGWQRFGKKRPITHKVGEQLLLNDLEGARATYIGSPEEHAERDEVTLAREKYLQGDFVKAKNLFPKSYRFEKTLLSKEDPKEAFSLLPKGLLTLFVGAYQASLFNKMVSKRLPHTEVVKGDLVKRGDNIYLAKEDSEDGTPTAPLFGYSVPFSEGRWGELEREVCRMERDAFRLKALKGISSDGIRREITFRPSQIESDFKRKLRLCFTIPKGCYATALIREILL
jgi:tRNA pseudouridine13 synthase